MMKELFRGVFPWTVNVIISKVTVEFLGKVVILAFSRFGFNDHILNYFNCW